MRATHITRWTRWNGHFFVLGVYYLPLKNGYKEWKNKKLGPVFPTRVQILWPEMVSLHKALHPTVCMVWVVHIPHGFIWLSTWSPAPGGAAWKGLGSSRRCIFPGGSKSLRKTVRPWSPVVNAMPPEGEFNVTNWLPALAKTPSLPAAMSSPQ